LVFGYESRPFIGAAFDFGEGGVGFADDAAESKETLATRRDRDFAAGCL
jgi:hypothetical protein